MVYKMGNTSDETAVNNNETTIQSKIVDEEHNGHRLAPTCQCAHQPEPTLEEIASNKVSSFYDMSGDKILIIFNHYQYMDTQFYRNMNITTRTGTFEDVICLEDTFRSLGFIVIAHHDFKHKDIMKYLMDVCSRDHSSTSCVAVAVMSHGVGAFVAAADTMYPVSDITDTLRAAPSLAGTPKLFFIQACRAGHTCPAPSAADPLDPHYLLLYSTYEDYVSYRRPTGTWLIQTLCQVITNYHQDLHLTDMITLVNYKVSKMSALTSDNEEKQMPVCEFFLQKRLML